TSALSKVLLSELQWPTNAEQELLESLQRPSSFNSKLRAKRMADRSAISDDTESSDALDNNLSGLLPTRPTAYLSRPMCTNALDLSQSLNGSGSLSRQLEAISELIDDHIHDANQWMYWKRGEAKENNRRQQFVQRKATSNAARVARGEQPEPELSEKELDRMFKTLPEPSRLDALLNTANLNLLTKGVTQSRGPALTKMFMAQALQGSE
ncbi:Eukaryotic translation initiation factor 3 subunit H, partial [Kickxella alabastrina]